MWIMNLREILRWIDVFYILMKLKNHEYAKFFYRGVEPIVLGVSDYLKVIK